MRVWGKGKPIIENWWEIKINSFTDKKAGNLTVSSL